MGRLKYLIGESLISFEKVQHVVMDEVDKLLAGDTAGDVINIMKHESMPSSDKKQVLMFSATVLANLSIIPRKLLQECITLTMGTPNGACPDIEQTIIEVNGVNRRQKLKELLHGVGVSRTIVFVKDITTANNLASFLWKCDINATILHGDRTKAQQDQSLEDFENGTREILVATGTICRGLGKQTFC